MSLSDGIEPTGTVTMTLMADAGTDEDPGRTALYRLYDSDGELLYVGITNNPERRFAQHAAGKHWWWRVARRRVEWFDKRSSALAAEEMAIRVKGPDYNVEHGRGKSAGSVSIELTAGMARALEMLVRISERPGGAEATADQVLSSLLIRELNARGLFGDVHCFHSWLGWPDGLTLEDTKGGICPCGRKIQPDGRWLPIAPVPPPPGEKAA